MTEEKKARKEKRPNQKWPELLGDKKSGFFFNLVRPGVYNPGSQELAEQLMKAGACSCPQCTEAMMPALGKNPKPEYYCPDCHLSIALFKGDMIVPEAPAFDVPNVNDETL